MLSQVITIVVLLLLVGAFALLRPYFQEGRSLKIEESFGRCVACGSEYLQEHAPGVYTCGMCGYEGGEGRGQLEAVERKLAWSGKPWRERAGAAREDLEDGARLLLAVAAEATQLRRRHDELRLDPEDRGSGGLDETRRDVVEAVLAAHAKLVSATEKVSELEAMPQPEADLGRYASESAFKRALEQLLGHYDSVRENIERERKRLEVLDTPDRA